MAMELKFHKDKLKELTGGNDNVGMTNDISKRSVSEEPNDNTNITLIFGYASVIWKPGFSYLNKWWGYIKNYKRRFWQGSPDHRGPPRYPGRVATLLPAKVVDDLEQKAQEEHFKERTDSTEVSVLSK